MAAYDVDGMHPAARRVSSGRALVLTVIVVSGIVLTDIAALRQPGDIKNNELSMASYFDSLTRRDDDAATAGPLASVQLAIGESMSQEEAREEVSEESSKALGGGLEDARRRAARGLAPSKGVQARSGQRAALDIAADMKNMLSTKQLFASARVRASPRDASDLRQEMLDMKDIDKIHTSADDGGDSFLDKAKEEENTLKKLVLLHSHAKVRLAQLTSGGKTAAEADALAAGRG